MLFQGQKNSQAPPQLKYDTQNENKIAYLGKRKL